MAKTLKDYADEIMAQQFGDLQPAQDFAQQQASRANWNRVGQQVAGAFGGFKPDDTLSQNIEQRGQRELGNAMNQGALRKEAFGEAKLQRADDVATQKAAEENDANSATSRETQGLVAQAYPNLAEQVKSMSHARLKEAFPLLEKLAPKPENQSMGLQFNPTNGAGYIVNHHTGEVKDFSGAVPGLDKGASTAYNQAAEMRKEYMGNPVVKSTQEMATAYDKIQRAAKDPSAAGDIATVYSFMKIMDPGSTVREGEFATAQNAGGVPDKIRAKWNAVLNGERLAPDVRADFLKRSKDMYNAQIARHAPLAKAYSDLAKKSGFKPEDIVLSLGLPTEPLKDEAVVTPEDQAAIDWAKDPVNATNPKAKQILELHGIQ